MVASKPSPRINVLCAPPNGGNPGMTTVDLAFVELAAREGFADVTYWRLWDSSEWLRPGGVPAAPNPDVFHDAASGLSYRNARNHLDEFLAADAIVFWGDFLHMRSYLEITADVLTHRTGLFTDRAVARDLAERHLLLKGQDPSVLARTISYGTTLGFNSAYDYAGAYSGLLTTFLSGIRRIWGRDSHSALIAQLHRPHRDEGTKGTDGALLLGHRDLRDREPTMGVFIGRSNLRPSRVGALGRALSERLRVQPRWLDWGREPGFWPMNTRRSLQLAWPGLALNSFAPTLSERAASLPTAMLRRHDASRPAEPTTAELLDQLARHSLVLTDTYHVALNAWRLGTPAICLTDTPRSDGWDMNSGGASAARDKRGELYSQFDAAPFLVDERRLERPISETVDGLATALMQKDMLEVIHGRIDALREHGRRQLTAALQDLVRV